MNLKPERIYILSGFFLAYDFTHKPGFAHAVNLISNQKIMKLYNDLLRDFKELSLAHYALGIIASSCLGSVAAMLILMRGHTLFDMFQLFIVVSVCMGYNALVLAQFKPKIIFNSLLISLATSAIFIIINIF